MDSTILSYPDRGAGGSAKWRGNHSPRLSEDLFLWLKPSLVFDPMCGSGTTGDVAKRMGIACWQSDLHSGFNILKDDFPGMADLIFCHDPYHDIIRYSGNVWGSAPHPDDLSRCPDYDTFIQRMDVAHYHAYQAVRPGGHLVVLVGDVKRKGALYPLQRDYRWYGEPVQMLIKLQHNVWSNGRMYDGMSDPRIMHEYVIVTRKPRQFTSAWMVTVRRSERLSVDQREVAGQTWQGIVWTALVECGNRASLQEIYDHIKDHVRVRRAQANGTDWQAIVRRVVQETCTNVGRGMWALPTYQRA
ncbi:MAG: hypothetical protein HRF47_10175 [Chloroflexota bacterium]|jgi:hypothetical protein